MDNVSYNEEDIELITEKIDIEEIKMDQEEKFPIHNIFDAVKIATERANSASIKKSDSEPRIKVRVA